MRHLNLFAISLLLLTAACAAPAATTPAPVPTVAGARATSSTITPMSTIKQSAATASYRLQLAIGPVEHMVTMDEAKAAKSGEVMVSGDMAMDMSGMSPTNHLEVHVSDMSGAVVSNKTVTIQIENDATKDTQNVPIAVMYDVAVGQSDAHYGNNVALMPGNYTAVVTVGGETATFHVTVPSA